MRLQRIGAWTVHQVLWRTARLGAWLVRIAVSWHPRGGAAVVSLVCGEDPYGGCWHQGTAGQARAAALLAREETRILEGQATLLEEIGDMTNRTSEDS